jgi:hypothetical protein
MFGSQVLDVVIGLVFIYLLLSIICTAANEMIASLFSLRGRTLAKGIANLLADKQVSGLAQLLYDHPLVQSLYRGTRKPSFIPSHTFAQAFLDGIAPGQDNAQATMSGIRTAINGLPDDSELRRILLIFLRQSGDDFTKFQNSIETWFDNSMTRVSGWYKRQSQVIVLFLAVLITVATNADTLQIVSDLSVNPALRATIASQALEFVGQQGNDAIQPPKKVEPSSPSSSSKNGDAAPVQQLSATAGDNALQSLKQTGIHFGWETLPDKWEWANKVIGLLLTTLAISLGAPFWFDILDKVIKIRSSGAVPKGAGATAKEPPVDI